MTSAVISIENDEFLQGIVGKTDGCLWINSFLKSPHEAEPSDWMGEAYRIGETLALPETHNTYFCVTVLKASRRIKDNFMRMCVLVLDDLSADDIAALPIKPSYVIETSLGNYQVGFILNDTPEARDVEYCSRVLRYLSTRGFVKADASGNNVVRYVRMAVGTNTKERGTGPFRHVLHTWEPMRCYDLPDVLTALGIDMTAATQTKIAGRNAGSFDLRRACEKILTAENLHDPIRDSVAHFIAKGISRADTKAMLLALVDASDAKTSDPARWAARRAEIPHAVKSAWEKFGSERAAADFEALRLEAEKLSAISAPDKINTILRGCGKLGAIEQRKIQEIIKQNTGISYSAQKKAQAEFSSQEVKDHLALARAVAEKIGNENILATAAHVWCWDDKRGIWRAVPDRELKQLVQHNLEEENEAVMRALVDGVAEVMKSDIYQVEHEWNRTGDVINTTNGELHWDTLGFWELRPHCREHYLTTQIPVKYLPEATCPRFMQFLREIFEGDVDSEAKAQALLEMIGYTLTCDTRFERFALLIGAGANGKSVLMEVIRLLVGRDNACAVQPSQFNNRFQRAHLHLKLANLVTEIAEGAEIADAELKAIVSGELTTAEHKFETPFDFRPYATCWFGTNHMPHTRDFSDALFRRALVVPFNRTFKAGENADPNLKEKLAGELPGILNLALQAYGTVLMRGCFTEPESCLKAKENWRVEADQVAQFMEDCCELRKGAVVASHQLYFAYKRWADSAGINRCLNHKNFTNRVQRRGGEPIKGTGGARMIAGVRLKSVTEGGVC